MAVLEDAAATVPEALVVVGVVTELEVAVEGLMVLVVDATRLAALQLATFEASIANRPWSAGQLL